MKPEEKIRVVSLIDSLGISGGGERIALELTKQLDPGRFERALCVSRWDPQVASTENGAAVLTGLREAGIEFLGLQRRARLAPAAWRRLSGFLRERGTDVLHAHKFGSNVWGALVGTAARVPVLVAHEHSWSYEGRWTRRFLDAQLIARASDAFIAVSQEDARRMVEVEGIDAEKVRYIPNGMPPVPQPGNPGDVRAELGLGDGPVIGTVSTLRPEKRLDLLLHAAARLVPSFPGLQVLIAGEGSSGSLEELVAELDLGARVHLLGLRTDVGAVLEALAVAVNCSDREGSPLSVMEYMEAGLPVVATRVGGNPDLVEDGETGVLVEAGDAEPLAAAIGGLLEDPDRATEMGRRGRERRRSDFTMEAMARRVEALYEELVEAKARDRGRA